MSDSQPVPAVSRERESLVAARGTEHRMTVNRSFKLLVRSRMTKTGESYTAARAALLAGRLPDGPQQVPAAGTVEVPLLATSDQAIRQRTGRGWEEWFDLLDQAGMAERPHREIARWVADGLGVVPLAWAAQAVTVSYERARGGRAVGQHGDGFTVTASRTIPVPPEVVFGAFADDEWRGRWLLGVDLRPRTATRPRSARFDWISDGEPDGTRVHLTIQAKSDASSTVTVEHVRLPDQAAATARKTWWREQLTTLKAHLESISQGGTDRA
jgi:uncharacterized protein YndB with AHSA1/START domain